MSDSAHVPGFGRLPTTPDAPAPLAQDQPQCVFAPGAAALNHLQPATPDPVEKIAGKAPFTREAWCNPLPALQMLQQRAAMLEKTTNPTPLTQDQLQALCREWQKILRLQDWDVTVEFKRERDLGELNYAAIPHQPQFKIAKLQILDPIDRDPNYTFYKTDYEHDVVHELLELHFSPFKVAEDGPGLTAQELAINLIATALLRLKRGGQND